MYSKEKSREMTKAKEVMLHIEEYFGYILFMTIASLGVYKIRKSLIMNDAFWHIKTGQWVVEKGLIHNCLGAWNIENQEWVAHEWLFGLFIYGLSKINYDAIVMFFEAIFFVIVFLCCKQGGIFRKSKNPPTLYWLCAIVPLFATYACMNTARPQYVSTLFVLLFIICLQKYDETKQKKYLYCLPFITVIWVNMHGGTAMLSYMMLTIYLVLQIIGYFIKDMGKVCFGRSKKKETIPVAIVLFLVVLAIMCNPYGYQMLIYPFENMKDTTMLAMISEWAAPDAKKIVCLIGEMIPILLGIVSLIQTDKKIQSYKLGLYLFFVLLYLRSERFISYLVIVQVCLITPYAFCITYQKKNNSDSKRKKIEEICNRVLLQLILISEIVGTVVLFLTTKYSAIKENKILPDELVAVIQEDNPKRLLNHYDAGGYLVYYDIPVFIDGRYEPFHKADVVDVYLKITNPSDRKEAEEIDHLLNQYRFDAYLLSTRNVSLIEKLEERASVTCIYEDENWIYYTQAD